MQEAVLISNAKPDQKSLDFDFLREQGIENIQSLAGKVWTDYNTHDPGITIVEQLIYAITELGYRSNFDIKDILAQNPDNTTTLATGLFTAPEILSNTPVLIDDFRKILIDIEGIRNAFVKVANRPELPVFIDTTKNVAAYTGDELVSIRGLYSVILELDKSDEFGDLNSTILDWEFPATLGLDTILVNAEVSFPDWFSVGQIFRDTINSSSSITQPHITTITLVPNSFSLIERRTYSATLKVSIYDGVTPPSLIRDELINITIVLLDDVSKFNSVGLANDLENALTSPSIELLVLKYNKKMTTIWEIVRLAQTKLNAYRNLCEDFVEVTNLKEEEVGVCLQIEVGPGADIEQIEAEIYFRIGNFLSPKIKFHSATELLAQGLTVDQVFEGPVLNHGFLNLKEFLTIDERKVLYVSDLIQIIMDIPGVISVGDIHLSSYVDNVQMNDSVMDCLAPTFEETHRLRLSVQKSSTVFFRDDDPTDPNKVFLMASKRKVKEKLRELEILDNSLVLGNDPDEFNAPEGTYRNLEEYSSVQYDFPTTYGIGSAGLPTSATDQRKAQAKQLKSYLLFSEQLLANLLSQLAHIKELFAIDTKLKKTYFTQRVSIPNAFPAFPDANSYQPYVHDENFNYLLQDIVEGKELYIDRRNKVLDHLLARFSEDFTTYSLKLFEVFGIGTEERLIKDKLNFLSVLPVISGERLRSYNYKDFGNTWETDNVPGFQKRVSRKLGIESFNRQSLYFVYEERAEDIARLFRLYESMDGNFPVSPTAAASVGTGEVAWIDLTGIELEGESPIPDEVSTGLLNENQLSKYLYVTGFGSSFSFIPSGATIEGIKVEIVKRIDDATGVNIDGDIEDYEIKLLKAGTLVGDNHARVGEAWPASRRYFTYGSSSDLWNASWVDTDFQDADFGVAIKVKKTGDRQRSANIDTVKVTVFYTPVSGEGVKYHFETQPEARSFGISSRLGGYDSDADRASVLTDVVTFGYNFCNYCKDVGSYRIMKATTVEDRDGMCSPVVLLIVDQDSMARSVSVTGDYRTKILVGDSVTITDAGAVSALYTVESISFDSLSNRSTVVVVETITSLLTLTLLSYEKIKTVDVVYSGSSSDSTQAAADFSDSIFDTFWDFEGMHVVEHLLLRPKVNEQQFEDLLSSTIVSPDQGRIRYTIRRTIQSINYDTNIITIAGLDLTGQLFAGDVVQTIDDYGNATGYTVQSVVFNSPDTLVHTSEEIEEDQEVHKLAYERSFPIDSFINATNSVVIANQHLSSEINYVLIREGYFVFEVYNSIYNAGNYRINSLGQVSEPGANTQINIQQIQKTFSDALLPIVISTDDCECPDLRDNYSFRISVVMPEWPVRFTNSAFRKLAERIIRYEAPAHVYVRLLWVDKPQMKSFEEKYKTWLEETSKVVPDPFDELASDAYRKALNSSHDALVHQLFTLRNKFSGSVISDITSENGSTGELSVLGQIYLG